MSTWYVPSLIWNGDSVARPMHLCSSCGSIGTRAATWIDHHQRNMSCLVWKRRMLVSLLPWYRKSICMTFCLKSRNSSLLEATGTKDRLRCTVSLYLRSTRMPWYSSAQHLVHVVRPIFTRRVSMNPQSTKCSRLAAFRTA